MFPRRRARARTLVAARSTAVLFCSFLNDSRQFDPSSIARPLLIHTSPRIRATATTHRTVRDCDASTNGSRNVFPRAYTRDAFSFASRITRESRGDCPQRRRYGPHRCRVHRALCPVWCHVRGANSTTDLNDSASAARRRSCTEVPLRLPPPLYSCGVTRIALGL